MAGRGQSKGAHQLPDDLLVKVLSALDFAERRRCVPLVCRRWAALVNTPELLAEVALGKDLKAHAAASLRSFIAWVVRRAAPHVRRLHLSLDLGGPGGGLDVLPTAVACALACCAFGGLDELSLCVLNGGLELGWAAALTSLRSLKIDAVDGCGVDIRQQMEHLTRMERLSLGGAALESWAEGARLPPSLTYLGLDTGADTFSLRQLSLLSHLERLHLINMHTSSNGYPSLSHLCRLTELCMSECDALPGSLGQLSWLRHLELKDSPLYPEGAAEQDALAADLQHALEPLTCLTHLVLDSLEYCRGWPAPAAVAGMTGLRSLLSWTLPLSAELPPGDYLRSLHRLALPADVAGRSLNALSNAVELRDLELSWPGNRFEGGRMSESALAALRWAARHPALQRLCTCLGGQPVPAVLLDAVTAAQRANPSLLIHSRSELHEQLLRGTLTYT